MLFRSAVTILERNGYFQGTSTTSVLGQSLTPALLVERLAAQFPLARLAEFCIGICIGHFIVARVEGVASGALEVSPVTRRRIGMSGIGAIAGLVIAFTVVGDLRQTSEIVVNSAFAAPLLAVLFVSVTLGVGPHVRLLSSRALVRLGAASYALYITQNPFDWWWGKITRLDLAQPASLTLFLAAIIAASLAFERWIETPAREHLLRRHRTNNWPWVRTSRSEPPLDALPNSRGAGDSATAHR